MKNQHILLLEDDGDTRELIKRHLNKNLGNITLYEATDPLEALEIFHQHRKNITHVISDHYLPNDNGLNFCQLLRSNNQKLKIYLLSADPTLLSCEQVNYCDGIFIKPTGLLDLEKELKK